jgi:hypothetical protein
VSFRKFLKCIEHFIYCQMLYCFHLTELEILLSTAFVCVSPDVGWIVQMSRHVHNDSNVMGSVACDPHPPGLC